MEKDPTLQTFRNTLLKKNPMEENAGIYRKRGVILVPLYSYECLLSLMVFLRLKNQKNSLRFSNLEDKI